VDPGNDEIDRQTFVLPSGLRSAQIRLPRLRSHADLNIVDRRRRGECESAIDDELDDDDELRAVAKDVSDAGKHCAWCTNRPKPNSQRDRP
jgi:hypothetical protein